LRETPKAVRVGVISDTHGLLRPEALRALQGASVIVHAGDIGGPEILDELNAIAPVTAVRGNNDREAWAGRLPETAVLQVGGARIYVIHDLKALAVDPQAEGFAAVISGHSHQPRSIRREGVLYFNPGSAGPRRFRLPVSLGTLLVEGGTVAGRLRRLSPAARLG
jgi:putative phosphoesterase